MITESGVRSYEWVSRSSFIDLIDDLCVDKGIDVEWLSDGWIARLEKAERRAYIQGYIFPLNSASAGAILNDKVSTYTVLEREGVPAVPHTLLRLGSTKQEDMSSHIHDLVKLIPVPNVIKPNANASGGSGVVRSISSEETEEAVMKVSARHRTLAVSPYMDIPIEYRAVMLDGEPRLVYGKSRNEAEWRHNLSLGAVPEMVTDRGLLGELGGLALAAVNALGVRFVSVDIAATPEGHQVMEVNAGVMMNQFRTFSAENEALVRHIYGDALTQSMVS